MTPPSMIICLWKQDFVLTSARKLTDIINTSLNQAQFRLSRFFWLSVRNLTCGDWGVHVMSDDLSRGEVTSAQFALLTPQVPHFWAYQWKKLLWMRHKGGGDHSRKVAKKSFLAAFGYCAALCVCGRLCACVYVVWIEQGEIFNLLKLTGCFQQEVSAQILQFPQSPCQLWLWLIHNICM